MLREAFYTNRLFLLSSFLTAYKLENLLFTQHIGFLACPEESLSNENQIFGPDQKKHEQIKTLGWDLGFPIYISI